jgi:hypothetical protein
VEAVEAVVGSGLVKIPITGRDPCCLCVEVRDNSSYGVLLLTQRPVMLRIERLNIDIVRNYSVKSGQFPLHASPVDLLHFLIRSHNYRSNYIHSQANCFHVELFSCGYRQHVHVYH